jgi:hypothetical protein
MGTIAAGMTRRESWQVQRATLAVLRRVTSLGFTVSVFQFPASLLGTRSACVEMRALDLSRNPPANHVARVVEGEADDPDSRCACLLAEVALTRA